jgi:hypothetical protein
MQPLRITLSPRSARRIGTWGQPSWAWVRKAGSLTARQVVTSWAEIAAPIREHSVICTGWHAPAGVSNRVFVHLRERE